MILDMKTNDIYEKVTKRILDMLEEGTVPWHMPWVCKGGPRSVHGHYYRGFNAFMLSLMPYGDPRWITFKQAQKMGGCVRKGEKGVAVILWKWIKKKDANGNETGNAFPITRVYTVFNVEQCDDLELPSLDKAQGEDFEPIKAADDMVEAWLDCPEIVHGGDMACYAPSLDQVRMPDRKSFKSPAAYYHVLFHELVHSTGHSKRLDRDVMHPNFGSERYSKEELVAELGSTFLRAMCGIDYEGDKQSAAYIKNWLHKLQNDPKMVVQAAQAAQKAADMIARIEVETAKAA